MDIFDVEDYKEFFDEAPVALLRTDIKTGAFLMANKYCACMLGYSSVEDLIREELITNLYSVSDRKRLIESIRKNNGVSDYQIHLTLKDGSEIWVSATLHINCGDSCIEGCLVNITEQKMLAQALKEAQSRQLEAMMDMNFKLDQALLASA